MTAAIDSLVPVVAGAKSAKLKKPPKPKPSVVRAYRVSQHANTGKVAAVAAVLGPYRDTMRAVQTNQWRCWLAGEKFWNRRDSKRIPTVLSQRYLRSAQNQVVAGLDSWLVLTQDKVARIITRSTLPGELKADLHWLNRCAAHHAKADAVTVPVWAFDEKTGLRIRVPGEDRPAPAATLALLRHIAKHVRNHRVSVPQLWRTRTMMLDGPVAQVEAADPKVGTTFPYWLRVSTLAVGAPARLPLSVNRFFDNAVGDVANFAQITVTRDNQVKVVLIRRSTPAPVLVTGRDVGLDWGLRSMFATDAGDQLGQALYPWLTRIDGQLTTLTVDLQRQGVKLSTNRRYRAMQRRIREYVRNEVGRVINRLLTIYDIRSFTVERLDFRDGGMSRRMNRILSRAGRGAISDKLAAIAQTRGITTTAVNPAHTSRECSGCGYIDPANRQGPHFQCRFCHKRLNADTNGARVISGRRSAGAADITSSRKTVLHRADTRFETTWGLRPGTAANLRSRPTKRRSTTPTNRRASSADNTASEVIGSRDNKRLLNH